MQTPRKVRTARLLKSSVALIVHRAWVAAIEATPIRASRLAPWSFLRRFDRDSAALSNSNELHWERNVHDLGVTDLFEVAISSHQVGLCKPDPRIYLAVLDRLGVSPEAVVFFDDVNENVVAASGLGMRAFQVNGVDGVRERLTSERIF